MVKADFHTHQMHFSPAQLNKLLSGGTVQLKHLNLQGGHHSIVLGKAKSRRVATALRKQKGLRLALSPEEILHTGGKINWKKVGRTFKHGLKAGYDHIVKPTLKNMYESGVIQNGLTGALTTVGTLAGVPEAGILASQLANKVVDYGHEQGAYGIRQSLKHAFKQSKPLLHNLAHTTKKHLTPHIKHALHQAVERHAPAEFASLGHELVQNATDHYLKNEEGLGLKRRRGRPCRKCAHGNGIYLP